MRSTCPSYLARFGAALSLTALVACARKSSSNDATDGGPRSPPVAPSAASGAPARSGGLSASATPTVATPAPAQPREPLNVILLTVDSLRTDVPWLGYERSIA